MQFILIGFTQANRKTLIRPDGTRAEDLGFRVFTFEGMEDQLRTEFLVKADLALTRRYDIPLQALPLMCRGLLERRNESEEITILKDVELARLRPHAHVRGKSAEYSAIYPDGRDQVLLSVPRYGLQLATGIR